jgi:hypothetical protein
MYKSRFQEALEYISDDMKFEVRSYPGRGIYGKTCIGITGEDINLLTLGIALGIALVEYYRDHDDDIPHYVYNYITDSYGPWQVIYWPHMEYVDVSTKEDLEHGEFD